MPLAGQVGSRSEPVRPEIMSRQKYTRLRALLPEVADARIQKVLRDERLILYTDTEMPKAYQDWDGGLQGVHSPRYNISANSSEPHGNANVEFPWGTPAGAHRAVNVSSFRFLWLPQGSDGQTLPVVWYRWRHPGDVRAGYEWVFPVGSVLGEVLCQRGPDGNGYTFEMRVRVREYGSWLVDVFRPFPRAEDLAGAIQQARPNWRQHPNLVRLVGHLQSPVEMTRHRLAAAHPRQAFAQSMGVDSLPPVDDDRLVMELLTKTVFRSALDTAWRSGSNGLFTCAPTTTASFHVVPANYDAGFVEVDPVSCMRCHDTVGEHAQSFEFGRDWYGRVRGSDGIFSFHPFSRGSISFNGIGQKVSMRPELLAANVLARYDPGRHPDHVYQRLE